LNSQQTFCIGFAVHPRRWVVERFFARLSRNRRLAKDFEASLASTEAFLYTASVMLLIFNYECAGLSSPGSDDRGNGVASHAHRSEDVQKAAGTVTRARPRRMIAAGTTRSRRRAFLRRIDQKAATEKRSWRRTIFLAQIGLGKGLDAEISGRQGQPQFPGGKRIRTRLLDRDSRLNTRTNLSAARLEEYARNRRFPTIERMTELTLHG
jgi:hypothetical protein